MERHETTMRAARYLLGAGMFAVAMLAVTTSAESAGTNSCIQSPEGDPTVCGHVFTDANGDSVYTPGDPGSPGEGTGGKGVIIYEIVDGVSHVVSNPTESGDCTNPDYCGYFAFILNEPGDYWVCLADVATETCLSTAVPVTIPESLSPQFVDFLIGSGGGNGEIKDADPPYTIYGSGTGTPGYWKNHPTAWPAEGVTVGGVLYQGATIQTAIKLMGKVGGDKTLTMFASLISAKLNTTAALQNNFDCIAGTLLKADEWLTEHPVASPPVKASSLAWEVGEPYHQKLDDYNNGKLCAPHRN